MSDTVPLTGQDQELYALAYKATLRTINAYVRRNNGSEADGEDVCHEALLVLLQKLEDPAFVLTTTVEGYVFSIARNLWLKRLRSRMPYVTTDTANIAAEENESMPYAERLPALLASISAHCQRLIKKVFLSEHDVSSEYKNAHTLHNQKYKCLQQLRKKAHADR